MIMARKEKMESCQEEGNGYGVRLLLMHQQQMSGLLDKSIEYRMARIREK